jgi:hypothetical protein
MTAVVLAVASIGVAALGPDDAQAKKVSQAGASLSIDTGPTGKYYAYAKATKRCKAAVSRSIRPLVD